MKTMLIIGGSRGIGAALAEKAIGHYNVAFTYCKSADKADVLQKQLSAKGSAKAFFCDAEDEVSIRDAVQGTIRYFGKIDTLVYCAGVSLCKLFTDTDSKEWRRVMCVNLDGAFVAARECAKDMLSRMSGSIILISSMWGEAGASMEVAYSASKAGLIGLGKALAKELAPSNIRVNTVAPGATDTDMMKCYSQSDIELIKQDIPLGRLCTPEEVADAILYLDSAGCTTGEVLRVNGGMVI